MRPLSARLVGALPGISSQLGVVDRISSGEIFRGDRHNLASWTGSLQGQIRGFCTIILQMIFVCLILIGSVFNLVLVFLYMVVPNVSEIVQSSSIHCTNFIRVLAILVLTFRCIILCTLMLRVLLCENKYVSDGLLCHCQNCLSTLWIYDCFF